MLVTHANMKGFGQAFLSGARCCFIPPQLKTKQNNLGNVSTLVYWKWTYLACSLVRELMGCLNIELVKAWVAKSQPSFSQILSILIPHIRLNHLTFTTIATKINLNLISTEVPTEVSGISLSPNVSTTFSDLKMIYWFFEVIKTNDVDGSKYF